MSTDSQFTSGVPCPVCGNGFNRVINSRVKKQYVYRRRECANRHKFTTHETTLLEPPQPEPHLLPVICSFHLQP